jgi:hypothetical protein
MIYSSNWSLLINIIYLLLYYLSYRRDLYWNSAFEEFLFIIKFYFFYEIDEYEYYRWKIQLKCIFAIILLECLNHYFIRLPEAMQEDAYKKGSKDWPVMEDLHNALFLWNGFIAISRGNLITNLKLMTIRFSLIKSLESRKNYLCINLVKF